MQQIKIFKGLEPDLAQLEKQINDWLAAEKVRVISLVGNIAPQTRGAQSAPTMLTSGSFGASDVLVMVLYEVA